MKIVSIFLFALMIFVITNNRHLYDFNSQKNINLDKYSTSNVVYNIKSKIVSSDKLNVPNFTDIKSITKLKNEFFMFMLPSISEENERLTLLRKQILDAKQSDTIWLQELAAQYKVDPNSTNLKADLLSKVNIIPVSIALAQSALESNWGRSRFASSYYNFFGLWCFKKGCGVVPNNRSANKKHEVASFDSLKESIRKYMHTLNTHYAYDDFRKLRSIIHSQGSKNNIVLTKKLENYSGIGKEYSVILDKIIKGNNLHQYDN